MSDERMIDDALRSVPVPEGLRSTLDPESLFGDPEIDRLVARVTVPEGLGDRIRLAVHGRQARGHDGAIDLSRFAAGHGAFADGQPLIRSDRQPARLGLTSIGRELVSVATALGLMVLLTLASIEFSRRLEGTQPRFGAITKLEFGDPIDRSPLDRPLAVAVPTGGIGSTSGAAEPLTSSIAEVNRDRAPSRSPADGDASPAATSVESDQGRTAGPSFASDPLRPGHSPIVRGAAVTPGPEGGIVGPSPLATVEIPGVARRRVPRVRGYDLAFEMTTGEQPFVDPGADPVLVVDHPPLTLRIDGYEALTASDRSGRKRIRTEEVLAAIPSLPGGSGEKPVHLSIHEVRGLPSAGGARTMLVEVVASAGSFRKAGHHGDPRDVTLVLDQAMAGDPAIWRRICRGVGDLATQLEDADRVTVVLCGPRPRVAVQAADRAHLSALASDLEWQGGSVTSDLDAGLLLAQPAGRVIVVAHTISLERAGGAVREALSAWHHALSFSGGDAIACEPNGGTRFIVLDPSTPSPSEWREPTFGRTSPDAVSIRRALIGHVTGRDTLVASQCDLEVRFDPRAVARYRLIGHRQSAVESLADVAPRGSDLHVGETVRAVYEVIPRSGNRLTGLASARLSWRTQDGTLVRTEAPATMGTADAGEGIPSPHGCELVLATGLGELAAGSSHVRQRPALLVSLERLVTEWRSRGDITAFGEALARTLDGHIDGRQR